MTITQKILNLRQLNEKNWRKSYPKLIKIIKEHSVKTMIEIGVAFGGNAESILKNTEVKKIFGIDRYKHDPSYKDPMNFTNQEFAVLKQATLRRLIKFQKRFELINNSSLQAAVKFAQKNIDLVYIDGDHTYKGCLQDILAWSSHLKNNGIISGHDYASDAFPGVTKAANAYAQITYQKVNYEGNGVWWLNKKPLNMLQILKLKISLFVTKDI